MKIAFEKRSTFVVPEKKWVKGEPTTKEKSYSSLTSKKISGKDYQYVIKVWDKFEMKTLKDYHELYLKYDVLFLADVFETFRNNSLRNYGLCQCHYLGALALS